MSNPFAPPGPQPPAQNPYAPPVPGQFAEHPQQHPAQHYPQAPYAAPGQTWAPQPFTPAPKHSNALAITAVVLSGLALLGVLAIAALAFFGSGSGNSGWMLSGTVTVVDKGVSDTALQDALVSTLEDDGSSVDNLVCPLRSQAGQGLVTVCHGSVDGWDWTGVVVFEDDAGKFIVTEY